MKGRTHPGRPSAPRSARTSAFARRRLLTPVVATCLLALLSLALLGSLATQARAAGNASAAAGFIESAQNEDGGFGAKRGQRSDATASLWAAVALLAGGKNPGDEWVKGGSSLDEYLASHSSPYTSLEDLGLLALVQSAAQGASTYGDPVAKLESALTPSAAQSDPAGGALAILGLIAVGTPQAKQAATSAAQALLSSATSDGGWGREGLSDSASTALVLQALAASGIANSSTPAVQAGVSYLHKAQANDGSIAPSIRTDQAIASGSVTATAFTIQALHALGLPTLATPTGKTVLQGLTQYQQQGSGGLSADGSLYSQIPPSVTETAQAFAAFDGISFPLAGVARATSGPPKKSSSTKSSAKSKHVSSGTAAQGVSGTASTGSDKGAFRQATASPAPAARKAKSKSTASAKAKAGKKAAAKQGASAGGSSISGEVVGASKPKLTTVAGQSSGGLSTKAKATLLLAAILLLCALLGGVVDSRRPRADGRSLAAVGVAASARFLSAARARGALVPFALVLVGAALIVFPLSTRMFERTPKGAQMISAFKPYMKPARLSSYETDVRQLRDGVTQAAANGPALLSPHASIAAAQTRFQASNPQVAEFARQWPAIDKRLSGLLGTIEANRSNYDAVAALPRFTLFPWFFIVPGALLILLAAGALATPDSWKTLRWAIAVLAIGLIVAPLVFGMWSRAPKGAAMVSAFRTVETRALVTKIQNDFGTITAGEGALGGELVPALEAHGLSSSERAKQLPAVAALESRWIAILQNLTPLLGVMSDNVVNYQAVAALPAFGAFPWLFLTAGLLILALTALGAGRPRLTIFRRRAPEPRVVAGAQHRPDTANAEVISSANQNQPLTDPKEHDVLAPT
jgi:hypothetical protein